MCSASSDPRKRDSGRRLAAALLLGAGLAALAPRPARAARTDASPDPPPTLRICADANNLPFSNARGEGFENALAGMVARDLGRPLAYFWWPQRRGFARQTVKSGRCNLIMGVPSSYELASTTEPYYRSTYVFVSRRDRRLGIRSFDDPRLARLRVGIHVVGGADSGMPPGLALAQRGIVRNVVSYSLLGDYAKPNPPAELIDAVSRGDVDVAVAWGPLAGYFAKRSAVPLEIVPVSPAIDLPFRPYVFDISMAVRRGNQPLRDAIDRFIERRRDEIRRLLESYGVPLVE